jgi:tetratricopeptide (TPR) repeat protein
MYNNLGVLAAQSGDRQKARSLWEKCAVLAHEINDAHRLAGIYNNLGIDSLENGNLQEAEEYYLKSLALFRKLKSQREQVEILSNLGELSLYRADYARSQAYLQEAVKQARQLDDEEGQIEPLVYLGKLLLTIEQIESADETLREAVDLAQQTGARKGEAQAWEGLAQLYTRKTAREQALEALEKAQSLISEDIDPLALLHLHLTECSVAAEFNLPDKIAVSLGNARKVADAKWDPYTEARTLVYGLLFAQEQVDPKERARTLRKLAAYPEFLWKYHWAEARRQTQSGALRKALDEYKRGVNVLKSISAKLSEQTRAAYLNSPQILRFKSEALEVRNSLEQGG